MTNKGGGYHAWLALLVGGLAVAVALVLYAAYGPEDDRRRDAPEVSLDLPTPDLMRAPDAPRLPDPPIPVPR